jgi:hypothetical protein
MPTKSIYPTFKSGRLKPKTMVLNQLDTPKTALEIAETVNLPMRRVLDLLNVLFCEGAVIESGKKRISGHKRKIFAKNQGVPAH